MPLSILNGHVRIYPRVCGGTPPPFHWQNQRSCATLACIIRGGHPQTGANNKDGARQQRNNTPDAPHLRQHRPRPPRRPDRDPAKLPPRRLLRRLLQPARLELHRPVHRTLVGRRRQLLPPPRRHAAPPPRRTAPRTQPGPGRRPTRQFGRPASQEQIGRGVSRATHLRRALQSGRGQPAPAVKATQGRQGRRQTLPRLPAPCQALPASPHRSRQPHRRLPGQQQPHPGRSLQTGRVEHRCP